MHRAKLDSNDALRDIYIDHEAACVEVFNKDGVMTKDLDMKWEHWVATNVYMDAFNVSRAGTLF